MPRQTLYRPPYPQIDEWPPARPQEAYSSEKARDVYLNSCSSIAAGLEKSGFKYKRSRQTCNRTCGSFIHSVAFQSSGNNYSGYHVQLQICAFVRSLVLKAWRDTELPERAGQDYVAGGMIHRLTAECGLVQWELANPADREDTIADAIAFIRETALPFFDAFTDPDRLLRTLAVRELAGVDIVSALELGMCFGGTAVAQRILDRYLSDQPDSLRSIVAISDSDDSTLVQPGQFEQLIAQFCRRFNLHWPGERDA